MSDRLDAAIDEKLDELFVHLGAEKVGPDARKKLRGLIRHYMKKPHPFSACVRDNTKRFGPERAKRICATLKDVGKGTKKWRKGNHSEDGTTLEIEEDTAILLEQLAELDLRDILNLDFVEEEEEAVDLIPSPAMASAAQRGLALAGDKGVEAAMESRARKIAERQPLTPALVRRMTSFFMQDSKTRPQGSVKGTAWEREHLLWGGDAGKAWAASKLRTLNANPVGASLGESSDDEVTFFEMFFSSPSVEVDENGLVWKPGLRTGNWVKGPNDSPLIVVDGHSEDQRAAIGIQDVVDAFEDGAVEHVTIPKSHEDLVDENTGYVRKLRTTRDEDGTTWLMIGHDFTEPEIKDKVARGSIANTSVGLEFDYVRKEDGKKYPVIMRHNALTNRPWINRLTPFGVKASDDQPDYQVESLCFSEQAEEMVNEEEIVPSWNGGVSIDEARDDLAVQSGGEVVDMALDRALVRLDGQLHLVPFTFEGGEVVVADQEEWVEQNDDYEDGRREDLKSTSSSSIDDDELEESNVPQQNKSKNDPKPESTSQGVTLSQEQFDLLNKQAEESAALKARFDKLDAKDRKREADDAVDKLKAIGFTEDAGCTEFLKKYRAIKLSDTSSTTLNLSEGEGDPREVGISQVLDELFAALPTDEKTGRLKVQLSEQHSDPLRQSESQRPPNEGSLDENGDKVELSDEDLDALYAEMRPEHAHHFQTNGKKES